MLKPQSNHAIRPPAALTRWMLAALVASAAIVPGFACSGSGDESGQSQRGAARALDAAPLVATPAVDRADIVLDGDIGDWPRDVNVIADSSYLYFRVKISGELETIQGMRRPLLARFDLDGNSATGARYTTPGEASDFGVDLEIVFSPRDEGSSRGAGVAINAVGEDGALRPIRSDAIDLIFAPSYASEWYEGRLSLAGLLDAGLPRPAEGGVGRQIFVLGDGRGGVAGWAPPAAFQWPAEVSRPARVDVELPVKAPGDIRIMTWNVERGKPQRDPEPFARIIRLLAPDILLLQEWDDASAAQIRDWFAAHIVDDDAWSVVTSGGRGVAIVARHELTPFATRIQPEQLNRPMRFAGAIVATEAGDVAVGNAHLRCCGYAGSEEDRIRMIEAIAINEAMRAVLDQPSGLEAPAAVVIGGDLNLVGSRPPLDALASSLDLDGSALETVEAMALGDRTLATWSSPDSIFTPSRLDYLLYSNATARVTQSLVLDTRLLSDATLQRLWLEVDDAHASDHRPVIVDLRLTP